MQPLAQLFARWNAVPKAARIVLGALFAIVATLATVATVALHPARERLFATPLHAEQLSDVEEQLAGWDVSFTPTPDNVIVDASRRNDLLLRLSLVGIPHAHVETSGEALANVGVLTPQAVIDAQTRAGLAGDIEAGLRGLEGIEDARVIVAPAKTAEFADESTRDASASVRVRLRAGAALSRQEVVGIRAFVAAGVAGLTPSHVTILDDRGVALDDVDAAGDAADVQRSLQSALDAAFGAGSTIVRVHAEYRGERNAEHDVRRVPLGNDAIARAARSESFDDRGKRYRRSDRTEDRGSETHELVSETQAGGIKRISTAVFLDVTRGIQTEKVRDLAAAAVGYSAARGDTLVVQAIDFHHERAGRRSRWWMLYGAFVTVAPALLIAAAIVLAVRIAAGPLFGLVQSVLERAAVDRTTKAVAGVAPSRVRNLLEHEPPHAAAAIISALPAATAAAVLDLYPASERTAIVARMQHSRGAHLLDPEDVLRRRA
ncbi:MAG: hypothetical protein JOY69_07545 [Candidatus Eremiobacteraeota bacterium]|nr:hypothetical protein [Candidatus Eremiobacteraeota bacterium]